MQTRMLRSFVQISKVGSFAKAADDLNMTLSALSMQMKTLEAELNTELFDRTVRPPRLTPVGRSLVQEAVDMLRQEDRMIGMCAQTEALAGHYKIGFVTTAAVRLLPPFLTNARKRAPDARFAFETGLSKSLQTKVARGLLDAAVVTTADGIPENLNQYLIRQEPFVFAAHKDLSNDGLEGLLTHNRFFHFMPDTGIGKLIAEEMATHHLRPVETIVLDNLEAIMECVNHGLGFTLLPTPDVTRYQSNNVQIIPSPHSRNRTLVLVTAQNAMVPAHEQRLAELMQVD